MKYYTVRDTIEFEEIQKWVELEKNVLIFGDHGVGKTTIISEAWKAMGLNYAFFSGSTLDPWVDLIGIPKLVRRNKQSVIEFALPQTINENLEAIFIDEYNRSQAAVRNAVLELIQFKSINGRKFPNLKVVWAAANPPDTDNNYDVEKIDPAQEDRFHIQVRLSGKPSLKYFSSRFGEDIATKAIAWYNNLPDEIKSEFSPRRLDYALDYVVNNNMNIRDVIPDERINVTALIRDIKGNSKSNELQKLINLGDQTLIEKFFKNQKNVQPLFKEISRNKEFAEYFILYGNKEEVLSLASAEAGFATLVFAAINKNSDLASSISAHVANHGCNPLWYDTAARGNMSSRAALDAFLDNKNLFSIINDCSIKVPEISYLTSLKTEAEILDDLNLPNGRIIFSMDLESAKNALAFFTKIHFEDFISNYKDDKKIIDKTYSLIYSAANAFYERDANLVGASFECKGCEKLVFNPPFGVKLAGGGSRGNAGRLSIKEEAL